MIGIDNIDRELLRELQKMALQRHLILVRQLDYHNQLHGEE